MPGTNGDIVPGHMVMDQQWTVQCDPRLEFQVHPVLGVGGVQRTHPFPFVVPGPIRIDSLKATLVQSLKQRHANDAFGHRQIARLRDHMAVHQDHTVRIKAWNRLHTNIFRNAVRRLRAVQGLGQHSRQRAVFPAF